MNINATFIGQIVAFIIFVIPLILSLKSNSVSGYHKLIWLFLSLFFSWLGFLVFYFLVIKIKVHYNITDKPTV